MSALAPVATPATYTVTGEPSYTYAITLPSSIIVTHSTNTNTMVINNLLAKSTSGVEAHNAIGTLTALEGSESFTVGGTLNVLAGQGPGNYSGDFNITVVYN